jgi:hypothetical protein
VVNIRLWATATEQIVGRYPMPKILAILVILLTSNLTARESSCGFASTKSQIDVCEPISVACPETVDGYSDAKFQANITRAASSPHSKIRYFWFVDWPRGFPKGRIKSGQGTPSIVVSLPRRAPNSLTAKVTVEGVSRGCPNTASCTTIIARRQ